jgi:hypothetical protein
MTDEERYLRETLGMLRKNYEKAAKPYINRLVEIQAMRPPEPAIVTVAQAKALGGMLAPPHYKRDEEKP